MPETAHSSWMNTELQDVRDLARRFFTQEVAPLEDKFREQGHPDKELYRRAGELGLVCTSIPQEYGGGGGTIAHEILLAEEQVRAGVESMGLAVHSGIVSHYINAYGSEEQKHKWLPKLAGGEWVCAIAMTEPGTGSDLQAIATRAVKSGDDYVINGAKTFITNGFLCDLLIIACRTGEESGGAGLSLIVAEVGDNPPGFERGRKLHKIGGQSNDTVELFFDDLHVPQANLLGAAEGMGFVQLMQQLPQERLLIGALAVASMESAVALTVEYTQQRTAFGKPLFALQNTRFELAECATITQVARTFLDDCVEKHLVGELDLATAAMVKYYLTQQQGQVVDRCLQLFGGYGYMAEYPIARLYTGARVMRILGGSNEVMKELIARSLDTPAPGGTR